MRWLWRLFTLVVFLTCLKVLFVSQPQAFISWSQEEEWVLRLKGGLRQLQEYAQDLPASIQVEVRRLWSDFQNSGNGKEV